MNSRKPNAVLAALHSECRLVLFKGDKALLWVGCPGDQAADLIRGCLQPTQGSHVTGMGQALEDGASA